MIHTQPVFTQSVKKTQKLLELPILDSDYYKSLMHFVKWTDNNFRDLDDNWQNEFGPMRIPKTHSLTRELVSRFGLELQQFYNKAHAFFVEDKRITHHEYVQVIEVF